MNKRRIDAKEIRELISNNIGIIKNLMGQEVGLVKTIQKLSNIENPPPYIAEIKGDLEDWRSCSVCNLNSYIANTDKLFKKYDKLLDSIL